MNDLKDYLKSIKARDFFKCQNPECRNKGKGKKKSKPLVVIHHINFDENNYEPWNLIALCLGCKVEARYNKAYSKAIYTEIINLKYPNNWNHLNKELNDHESFLYSRPVSG